MQEQGRQHFADRGDVMALETQRREDLSEPRRVSMGRHVLRRRVGAAPEKKRVAQARYSFISSSDNGASGVDATTGSRRALD
ncbi:hypothetical protein ACFQAT_00435 [Undibacterium arcticum]|uniref:hypothetical protein n=1 Tax=Undibacterium arcticum TaxID=1762892 RepID=UPI00360B78C3